MQSYRAAILVSSLLLAGASARAAAQATPAQPSDSVQKTGESEKPRRWQGTFRASRRAPTGIPGPVNKFSGSVSLAENEPGHVTVQLSLSTSLREAGPLQWAIVPGNCTSRMAPLTSIEQFPLLEVSQNGSARLDIIMPLTIPPTGQFSLNIYLGGASYHNILACANLSQAR